MTKNLTQGSPILLILAFAAPLIAGNLFQQFYNMADSFIVGRTIGMNALAAIGATSSINFLIIGFVSGLTLGATIPVSQRFGANDSVGIKKSFAAGIVLSALFTIILMGISIPFTKVILRVLNTPEEIFDGAYIYIIIILWGLPAQMLFNIVSNVMRAVGNSKTPLIFLVIASIINIILDYVFILVLHTGLEGAAYATVIAQFFSGLACIPFIIKKLPILKINKSIWKTLSLKEILSNAKAAIPMGFQISIIAIGAIAVTYAVNSLGTTVIAAFTAGLRIDQIVVMPLQSFGLAMTTFAAQNYGAKKYARVKKSIVQTLILDSAFAIIMAVIYFFFGDNLGALFLGDEKEAITITHTYLKINGAFYPLLGWLFLSRSALQGLGDYIIPTLSGIFELAGRVLCAIIFGALWGAVGISFANPAAWLLGVIPLTLMVVIKLKTLTRKELSKNNR